MHRGNAAMYLKKIILLYQFNSCFPVNPVRNFFILALPGCATFMKILTDPLNFYSLHYISAFLPGNVTNFFKIIKKFLPICAQLQTIIFPVCFPVIERDIFSEDYVSFKTAIIIPEQVAVKLNDQIIN